MGYVAARVCEMASGRAKELSHWCTVSPARTSKSEAACETERRIQAITPQSRQSILNSWPRACGRVADAAERCKRTAASATFQRAAARPQRSPRTPVTVPGHQRPPSKCLLDTEYRNKPRYGRFASGSLVLLDRGTSGTRVCGWEKVTFRICSKARSHLWA